jgi:hypothetical protein
MTTITAPVLTEEQLELLPSDEEVAAYRAHGWYKSKKLFSDEQIESALRGSDRFYTADLDPVPARLAASLEKFKPSGEYAGLRKHDYASFFNRELAALTRAPIIGAIAARLAGADEIRLWHDQLLFKPADTPDQKATVGWHTDKGYWKTASSLEMITAWIPFHDCSAAMGTITMIDGSLHWPDNTQKLNFFSADLDGLEREFNSGGQPVVKIPVELKAGEVSFHHSLTIHGSGPNTSTSPRRSIAVHLQPGDNRWREVRFAQGRLAHHANDDLVRRDADGNPDYTDPEVCPALWARP